MDSGSARGYLLPAEGTPMRFRRSIAVVLLAVLGGTPQTGCAGAQGQAAANQMLGWVVGIGLSVGTYFLIKELE